MAIEKVTESWQDRDLDAGTDDASMTRVFDVTFDGAGDPVRRPLDAYGAIDPSSGVRVPAVFQRHPNNAYLWVRNKRIESVGPLHFRVFVFYTARATRYQAENEPMGDPLNQPWEISWGFIRSSVPIDRYVNDWPLVNSAGESFDPPIMKDRYDLTLSIVRNQAVYNHILAADYIDSVNTDYFWGFGPGMVCVTDFSGHSQYAGDLGYWRVQYSFIMRADGWQRRKLDEGFREYMGVDEDLSTPIFELIKDNSDPPLPVNQPVLLNGHGRINPAAAPAVWLYHDINKHLPFNILGL